MSSIPDRNPSPPPEILQDHNELLPDRIGDSVYSKQWLIRVLMNILEVTNKEINSSNSDGENLKNLSKDVQNEGNLIKEHEIVELDSKIEEDVCVLWDMSANEEVAKFLHENRAPVIFLEVLHRTKSPRLLEIVIGILGNLASFDSLCQELSKNEALVRAIVSLSGTSDAPTIIQVLRLIHTGILNKDSKTEWFSAITSNQFFMENMKFILQNSLSGDILKSALQVLYYVFDENEDICDAWATESHIRAFIEAADTLLSHQEFESIDELFMVMNILCQYKMNIKLFAKSIKEVTSVFSSYILSMPKDMKEEAETHVHQRVNAIASAFATYSGILVSPFVHWEEVKFDISVLIAMQDLVSIVKNAIDVGKKADCKPTNKDVSKNIDIWEALKESILYLAEVLHCHEEGEEETHILLEILRTVEGEESTQ